MLPKLSWSTEVGLKAYDQGWDFRQGQPENSSPALRDWLKIFNPRGNANQVCQKDNRTNRRARESVGPFIITNAKGSSTKENHE